MNTPADQPPNLLPFHPAPPVQTAPPIATKDAPEDSPRPTSLDTHESNVQLLCQPENCWQRHRHEDWQPQRIRIAQTLQKLCTGQSTLKKFCTCGSRATILQHVDRPTVYKLASNKCRHRLCAPCQRERGWMIRQNIMAFLNTKKPHLSLATFTLKHTQTALRPTLTRLIKSFHELRRTLLWKRGVRGGCWILEIKRSKKGTWHPHIHCLIDAHYLPQHELSAAWLTVTGDSSIVDVRRISHQKGTNYVTKYITKPIDDSVWKSQDSLEEWLLATRGLRRCSTIGNWRGIKLSDPPELQDYMALTDADGRQQWRELCSFDDLLLSIKQGDPAATVIYDLLTSKKKGSDP